MTAQSVKELNRWNANKFHQRLEIRNNNLRRRVAGRRRTRPLLPMWPVHPHAVQTELLCRSNVMIQALRHVHESGGWNCYPFESGVEVVGRRLVRLPRCCCVSAIRSSSTLEMTARLNLRLRIRSTSTVSGNGIERLEDALNPPVRLGVFVVRSEEEMEAIKLQHPG
ncbi:MAG: hypothetical protein AAB393_16230, partial [Bacteroidota bacterium]